MSESDKTVSIRFTKSWRIAIITTVLFMGMMTAMVGTALADCEQTDIDGDGEDEYNEDCPGYGLCNTPYLSSIVNFIANLVVYGGIVFGLIGYAGASLVEAIPFVGSHLGDQVKQWQGNAVIGVGKVLIVPAIALAVLSVAGIGIPACVNFAFWG